jgi:hypothetical protein
VAGEYAEHAYLSPSGSPRWMRCPGAPRAQQGYDSSSSVYAREGTAAHQLAALVLTSGREAAEWIGETMDEADWIVSEEMATYVQEYADYVDAFEGERAVEVAVDLSRWIPKSFGTSDAAIITDDRLVVIDLKYGMGLRVEAEHNSQLMIYAVGMLHALDWLHAPSAVTLIIHQPRLGSVSSWETSAESLYAWADGPLREAASACLKPWAERIPSEEACRWCRAKADCPELRAKVHAIIMADFDPVPPDPAALTDLQLSEALRWKPTVNMWFKAIEARVRSRAEVGDFPGWKIVAGRATRGWKADSEEALVLILGDDAYRPKTLISPAQAEKALGKKRKGELADLILRPAGNPTLVPDSDPRPSLAIGPDDFDNLEEDGD